MIDDVYQRIIKCASDAFDLSENELNIISSMDNVKEWDSLGHIRFVIELENEFNITFLTEQIPLLRTIDIVYDIVKQLLNKS